MKLNAKNANELDKIAREYKLENDQDFISWQDSLNEVSIR